MSTKKGTKVRSRKKAATNRASSRTKQAVKKRKAPLKSVLKKPGTVATRRKRQVHFDPIIGTDPEQLKNHLEKTRLDIEAALLRLKEQVKKDSLTNGTVHKGILSLPSSQHNRSHPSVIRHHMPREYGSIAIREAEERSKSAQRWTHVGNSYNPDMITLRACPSEVEYKLLYSQLPIPLRERIDKGRNLECQGCCCTCITDPYRPVRTSAPSIDETPNAAPEIIVTRATEDRSPSKSVDPVTAQLQAEMQSRHRVQLEEQPRKSIENPEQRLIYCRSRPVLEIDCSSPSGMWLYIYWHLHRRNINTATSSNSKLHTSNWNQLLLPPPNKQAHDESALTEGESTGVGSKVLIESRGTPHAATRRDSLPGPTALDAVIAGPERKRFLRNLRELRNESWLAVLIAGSQVATVLADEDFSNALEEELQKWWCGP